MQERQDEKPSLGNDQSRGEIEMSQTNWIKTTSKFGGKCIQCGLYIEQGQTVLWMRRLGIKHEECPTGFQSDDSALVIIEEQDKERLGIK